MGVFKLRIALPASGSTVEAKIRRDSDGAWLDFSDGSFKTSGHVDDILVVSEPDSVEFPGLYQADVDATTWTDGIYVAAIYADGTLASPSELIVKSGELANTGAITADEIDAELTSTHGAGDWVGTTPAAIDAELTSSHGAGDWVGTTPAAIDAELTSTHGAGTWTTSGLAGTVVTTVTIKEDDTLGATIPLAEVDVYTPGGTFLDRQFSDTAGKVLLPLDPGITYHVFLSKSGVPIFFTRPAIIIVPTGVSTYETEFYGIPFAPLAPTEPGSALVYDYLFNLGIDPRPGVEVTARVSSPNKAYLSDGPILTGPLRTKTDSKGLFQFTLPRQVDMLTPGVKYEISIDRVNFKQEFDASDLDAGGAIILSSLSI